MVRRIWAGLAGGFFLGFVVYMLSSMFTPEPQIGIFLGGWVVLGFLVARSGHPWSNTWLFLAVGSFLLPLAVFFGGINIAANEASIQSSDSAMAGAALGSLFAGGVAAFVGFFTGIVFAMLAFFTRRSSNKSS